MKQYDNTEHDYDHNGDECWIYLANFTYATKIKVSSDDFNQQIHADADGCLDWGSDSEAFP